MTAVKSPLWLRPAISCSSSGRLSSFVARGRNGCGRCCMQPPPSSTADASAVLRCKGRFRERWGRERRLQAEAEGEAAESARASAMRHSRVCRGDGACV